jgi:hypothetical protein
MRKLQAAVWGAMLGVALLLVPANAASAADEGNGNNTCDRYEICFRAGSHSGFDVNAIQQHTYYNGSWNHSSEYLWAPWQYPTIVVMDHVKGVWNRDSSCRIQLWDYYNGWYVYADLPMGYRGDAGYEINNAHTRCG